MDDLPKGLQRVKGKKGFLKLAIYEIRESEFENIPSDMRFQHEGQIMIYIKGKDDELFLRRYGNGPFHLGFLDGLPDVFKDKEILGYATTNRNTWRLILAASQK